uniref:Odorant receptor n=1 Tax=Yemma signatus TaxID=300820 RepID=A0A385H5W9_9HEMI|nr:odorant receptor [Yemma signatus]
MAEVTEKELEFMSIARNAGMFKTKSLLSTMYPAFKFLVMSTGLITCIGQVVVKMRDESPDLFVLVEALHWVGVLFMMLTWQLRMWLGTKSYFSMNDDIKAGFYKYSVPFESEDIALIQSGNDESRRFQKRFNVVIFFGCFSSMLRDPIFGETIHEEGSEVTRLKFYNTWFPFQVNTWPRYGLVCVFQFFLGLSVLITSMAVVSLIIGGLIQLSTSFRLLQLKISRAHLYAENQAKKNQKSYEDTLYEYLVECVKHHQALIRFFRVYQNSIALSFLVSYLNAGVIICTVGFIITDPDSNLRSSIAFLSVVATEFIFFGGLCYYGERIVQESGRIFEAVYNTPWYTQSKRLSFLYYMFMVRSRKPLTPSAYGLKAMSLSTFGDILQAAYSYLNMLSATRK